MSSCKLELFLNHFEDNLKTRWNLNLNEENVPRALVIVVKPLSFFEKALKATHRAEIHSKRPVLHGANILRNSQNWMRNSDYSETISYRCTLIKLSWQWHTEIPMEWFYTVPTDNLGFGSVLPSSHRTDILYCSFCSSISHKHFARYDLQYFFRCESIIA